VLDEAEYSVRYERGNFQSGYWYPGGKESGRLNQIPAIEGRINTLFDIILSEAHA